ncbi:hypothetical protein FJZ31_10330 [Candidatus Poribacteria bacterium]|nr:hypothetical protein [Candidatus Poribacteria bacterium]
MVKDSENIRYRFGTILFPVDDLGEEDGRKIDILFGAVILEDWGTVIDESAMPPKIDYAHKTKSLVSEANRLRKGELVELKETPYYKKKVVF